MPSKLTFASGSRTSHSTVLGVVTALALTGCAPTLLVKKPPPSENAVGGTPTVAAATDNGSGPASTNDSSATVRRPLAPSPSTPPGPNGETETKPPLTSAAVVPGAPKPPEAPVLKPFAEVIRGAKEGRGFFGVWQKDDGRVWLEVSPDQLEKPFFFSISLASGLGERFFLPGLMGQEHVVVLRRFGNQLQLVAKNMRVRAPAGTPLARAVSESFSDSLLAAAPVISAPHPERRTFLIDAAVLLGGDIAGAQTALDSAYRMGYALDRANGSIEQTRTGDVGTFITYRSHFAVARMPTPPAALMPTGPNPPSIIPDPRSLFLTFTYNLVPLPAEPMRPRLADQRVGHFTTAFRDFGAINADDRRTHYVERWRLEKKEPQAAVSEPKEPIPVWLDRNIPEKYRDAVRAGALEWNKAFERAGFKNAIVVRQQPDDADWSTVEGTRHLAVRWFAMEGPGAMAVGPSQSDPRTGELLRGAAIIPENWVRVSQAALTETLPGPSAAAAAQVAGRPASLAAMLDGRECSYAHEALEQVAFGLELLAARGQLDAGGVAAERFIAESLKDVVMHEVGHALGLRHNFKASAGVKLDKLRDAAWVRENGVSNSVMDYVSLNIPLANEPVSVYTQSTLGAYDYWAIEYAYRELSPEQERDELARIAARSITDARLAYATDEEVGGYGAAGIDPLVNPFDLGDDPLAYYKRRFTLARELWTRTQSRELAADESLAFYRRNLARGLNQIGFTAPLIAKYVGGVYTSRQLAGAGQPVLAPVPAGKQREALALLAHEVFSTESFRFDPNFMGRLGIDHLERFQPAQYASNPDFSLATSVLGIQRGVLDQLMADGLAARLADAETKLADRKQLLTFADVQTQLADAIWSELKTGRSIDSLRRNLQREHLRRLAGALLRPTSGVAADVRSVQRQVALRLEADLRRAVAGKRGDATERAHLAESQAVLTEALRAPLWRQGV